MSGPENQLDPSSAAGEDIIARARRFAAQMHGAQRRKYSDEPYIVHLDRVVAILIGSGVDAPIVLAAAYLHDTLEDTAASLQDILDQFGSEVAELVYWLTDAGQGNRKTRKIMSAWRLGRAPFEAKLVKLADFIDNSTDIARKDPHFAPVYMREKALVLEAMAKCEGEHLTRHELFKRARAAER